MKTNTRKVKVNIYKTGIYRLSKSLWRIYTTIIAHTNQEKNLQCRM